MIVAVVGPCAAGKSTLVAALRAAGYTVRHVAQEHSYVPDMWRRLAKPDVLIYLDATLDTISQRQQVDWKQKWLDVQVGRLGHARQHCDLYLATDGLTPEEIQAQVIAYLRGLET